MCDIWGTAKRFRSDGEASVMCSVSRAGVAVYLCSEIFH